MSSSALPDLSSLAALARDQNLDLRSVLLRVQTDLFIAAPSRNQETISAFESLALGFLGIVDDDTAGTVAHKLAPLADTPPRVIQALLERGGQARRAVVQAIPSLPHDAAGAVLAVEPGLAPLIAARADLDPATLVELLGRNEEAVDLALARNRTLALGRAVHDLVERGRERPPLAAALLARGDLGIMDEAALYSHADALRRAGIRGRLETHGPLVLAPKSVVQLRADSPVRDNLLARAADGDEQGFKASLAEAMGIDLALTSAWRLDDEARRELIALALVAASISSEDVVRTFLMLDRATARSVSAVFHIAKIARSTPRPVAIYLTEATLGTTTGRGPAQYIPHLDASGTPDRSQPLSRAFSTRVLPAPHRRDLKAG